MGQINVHHVERISVTPGFTRQVGHWLDVNLFGNNDCLLQLVLFTALEKPIEHEGINQVEDGPFVGGVNINIHRAERVVFEARPDRADRLLVFGKDGIELAEVAVFLKPHVKEAR